MSKLNKFGGQWLVSDRMVDETDGSFAIFEQIHVALYKLQEKIDSSGIVAEVKKVEVEFNPSNTEWGYNLRVKALCLLEQDGKQS